MCPLLDKNNTVPMGRPTKIAAKMDTPTIIAVWKIAVMISVPGIE